MRVIVLCCSVSCCTCFDHCAADMGLGVCVWYCYVPGHGLTSSPWQQRGPIWSFVIISDQADRLLDCWYLSPFQCPPDDVIQLTVALLPGGTSAVLRQDSPCSPRASTGFPHTHVCGTQALHPNRWATATLTASSDSLSPTVVIGGA